MFCTVHKFGSTIYCKAPLARVDQLNTSIGATRSNSQIFETFLSRLPAHVRQLLGNLKIKYVDVGYWIEAINTGIVTIVIDGSVADRKGYFAMVLHTEKKSIHFQGPCDGAKSLMTSYRAELTGILSALYLLCAMAKFSKSKIEHLPTLLCNNSAAVLRTNTPIYPRICAHLAADYNIYKKITNVIQANIKVKPQWVKAHQDQTNQIK
eukprot:12180902-Ditylum_brightwellii.AAC.1